jgi:hypothetical protein
MNRVARTISTMLTAAALTSGILATSAEAATPSSVAIEIANYALGTATHDAPAHVVTAADVTNAGSIFLTNVGGNGLTLVANLGAVVAYPRLVIFASTRTYDDVCVNFPNIVGGVPKIIPCPSEALGLFQSNAVAMTVSDEAISKAAASGRAVSGADVVAVARKFHETFLHTPTFSAGQGGKVDFTTKVEMGASAKFTVHNCVQLPKTAYGIPTAVAC